MAIDRSRAGAPLSAPPRPPPEWTAEYGQQLLRWLQTVERVLSGVSYGRFSGLFLPGLPTSGYNLRPGEVFANAGVLTVVREDDIWVGGFAISVDSGSVTTS